LKQLNQTSELKPLANHARKDLNRHFWIGLVGLVLILCIGWFFNTSTAKQTDLAERDNYIAIAETSVLSINTIFSAIFFIISVIFHLRAKNAQRELLEEKKARSDSENAFHLQFSENSAIMLIIGLIDGKIIDANKAAVNFYKYNREELTSKTFFELTDTPREQVEETIRSIKIGSGAYFTFHQRLADGATREVETNASLIESDNRQVLHLSLHDITERRHAEVELRKLSRAVEYSPISIVITDPNGAIEYVNPKFTQLTGYTSAEASGKNPRILNAGESSPELFSKLWQTISAGKVWSGILYNKKKNGEKYWESATIAPILDDNGKITHYLALKEDITARKLAEDDLKISSERVKLAALAAKVGIWDLDVPSDRLVWDEQMYAIYGLRPDPNRNSNHRWRSSVHPDDLVSAETEYKNCLYGSGTYDTEFRILHGGDGKVRFIRAAGTVLKNSAGKPIRMIGVNWDVTREKERELALMLSEELFKQMPGLVFSKDSRCAYIHANQVFCNAIEQTLDQIVGKTDLDFLPAEAAAAFITADQRILSGQDKEQYSENDFYEGKIHRLVATRKVPVKDPTGKIIGLIGLGIDITERKQIEQTLLDTNSQLAQAISRANEQTIQAEAASKAKSSFLTNISHEIRTPLNGVLGLTGMLLDTDLTTDQQELANLVIKNGESLLTLVNSILDFSQAEAHKMELEILDFDLREMMNDVVEILAKPAEEKGLDLRVKIEPGLPGALRGDLGRLRQVIINLAENAIKFTSRGNVLIYINREKETEKEICLLFSVEDTGIGIPSEEFGRLFKQFNQLDNSSTRKYGGAGLGLAISKELVELMHGQIGVDSKVGNGSSFWFSIPLEKQPLQRPAAVAAHANQKPVPPAPISAPGKHVRILLVEDNMTNQLVALSVLKKLGYQADAVANGLEALHNLQKIPYHLVLMDCQMPEMDGFAATAAIRSGKHAVLDPNIPIIAMTAHAMQGDREACLATGMDDYLSKPIKTPELAEKLASWLQNPQQEIAVHNTPAESQSVESSKSDDSAVKQKPAVFDEPELLKRLMDDRELEKLVIEAFLFEMPQQLEKLNNEIAANNPVGARLMAHTIRGASANLAAEALRLAAHDTEKSAEKGDLAAVADGLQIIKIEFEIFKETISNLLVVHS